MTNGFDTVDLIGTLDSSDLDVLRIDVPGHRKKILLAIGALKGDASQQSSLNVELKREQEEKYGL